MGERPQAPLALTRDLDNGIKTEATVLETRVSNLAKDARALSDESSEVEADSVYKRLGPIQIASHCTTLHQVSKIDEAK